MGRDDSSSYDDDVFINTCPTCSSRYRHNCHPLPAFCATHVRLK